MTLYSITSLSTLVEIMAWCLYPPSHHLNQCWLIFNWNLINKYQWILNQNTKLFFAKIHLENVAYKVSVNSGQCFQASHQLTHSGTHICVVLRQAIIWANVGLLLIAPLGIHFSGILIKIITFSVKKMHLKMSGNWCPFCFGLNGLTVCTLQWRCNDVSAMASQITDVSIVYSTVCSGADQRKHQSSWLLCSLFRRKCLLVTVVSILLPEWMSWWRHQIETFSA